MMHHAAKTKPNKKKHTGRKRSLKCFLSEKMVDFHLLRGRKALMHVFRPSTTLYYWTLAVESAIVHVVTSP